MNARRVGVIINGATGRMGTTQHLAHLLAIAREGGLPLRNGDRLVPEPLLVGRDAARLHALSEANGDVPWTVSLDEALAGPAEIYMDCAATGGRPGRVRRAITAGKHIHIEKPTAPTVDEAMALARAADAAGLKHGVIQDKLFLPGFANLMLVRNARFFGRILQIRVDAGSWVFDGLGGQPSQRPSWNYKKAEGGGLALDMMAHWRYMIDRLAAPVTAVSALMTTAIPERVDERGKRYSVDVEDTSHALLQLEGGAVGVITNSWATRVRREDTMLVQIDGTDGSAVAGRQRCFTQGAVNTPEAFFGPNRPGGMDLMSYWQEVPDTTEHKPPFRQCWEAFLRHFAEDAPYVPTLVEGAKAVQLADAAYRSVAARRWIELEPLSLRVAGGSGWRDPAGTGVARI
jgi:predicted dehydrogenase